MFKHTRAVRSTKSRHVLDGWTRSASSAEKVLPWSARSPQDRKSNPENLLTQIQKVLCFGTTRAGNLKALPFWQYYKKTTGCLLICKMTTSRLAGLLTLILFHFTCIPDEHLASSFFMVGELKCRRDFVWVPESCQYAKEYMTKGPDKTSFWRTGLFKY